MPSLGPLGQLWARGCIPCSKGQRGQDGALVGDGSARFTPLVTFPVAPWKGLPAWTELKATGGACGCGLPSDKRCISGDVRDVGLRPRPFSPESAAAAVPRGVTGAVATWGHAAGAGDGAAEEPTARWPTRPTGCRVTRVNSRLRSKGSDGRNSGT